MHNITQLSSSSKPECDFFAPVLVSRSTHEIQRRQQASAVDTFIKSGSRQKCPRDLSDCITEKLPQTPVCVEDDTSQTIFDLGSLRLWHLSGGNHPRDGQLLEGKRVLPLSFGGVSKFIAFFEATATRLTELGCKKRAEEVAEKRRQTEYFRPIPEALVPLINPEKNLLLPKVFKSLGPKTTCSSAFLRWQEEKKEAKKRLVHLCRPHDFSETIFSNPIFSAKVDNDVRLCTSHAISIALLEERIRAVDEHLPAFSKASEEKLFSLKNRTLFRSFLHQRDLLEKCLAAVDQMTVFKTMRLVIERDRAPQHTNNLGQHNLYPIKKLIRE